jgi:hypothetical protein
MYLKGLFFKGAGIEFPPACRLPALPAGRQAVGRRHPAFISNYRGQYCFKLVYSKGLYKQPVVFRVIYTCIG